MSEAKHSPMSLREAFRDSPCPRPANGEPDDQTVGACFDRGKCGCQTGAAIDAATSLHAELVAALESTSLMLEDAQSGFISGCGSDAAWDEARGAIIMSNRALLQKAKQR